VRTRREVDRPAEFTAYRGLPDNDPDWDQARRHIDALSNALAKTVRAPKMARHIFVAVAVVLLGGC